LNASRRRLISEAYMDRAYDSWKTYEFFKRMGMKPVIKPRENARKDRGPPKRRIPVIMLKTFGEGSGME